MNKKILIVEDDSFLQGLAVTKLKKEGYDVSAAAGIKEAIAALADQKPDLVILDLLLPGGSGFDVLENIRQTESTKALPVIVFSNLSEDKDIARAKELGASQFMTKSNFTLDELVAKIKELVG